MSKRVIVIMAGGSGERFWPLSRKHQPKQLLPLTSDQPMLTDTVDRAKTVVPQENIYIVAGPHLTPQIREILPFLPERNFITEPVPKNTAPCLALAAGVIAQQHGEDAVMGVLSADSLIRDVETFCSNAELAFEYAENNQSLVLMGIRPRHPDTGFGYLEIGPALHSDSRGTIHGVKSFREKPNAETARHYLETGQFLWNSGMFFWKVSVFLNAMEKVAPHFAEGARDIGKACGSAEYEDVLKSVFEKWPSISIDYALLEQAENVSAVAGAFDWDDVGTWSALIRTNPLDENGNVSVGKVLALESQGCIIFNKMGKASAEGPKPIVAALGIENLVVVATDDAILVCPGDRVQDIKKILGALKSKDPQEHI